MTLSAEEAGHETNNHIRRRCRGQNDCRSRADKNNDVVLRIREVVFEEFVKSDNYGLIFTYMWGFDHPYHWEYLDRLADIFRRENAEIYYVELVAAQEIRLARNATENRLRYKATLRELYQNRQL